MTLHGAFFLLFHPFAEHFPELRIHLSQIAIAEALAVIHLRAPVAIALEQVVNAPFEFRRRTLLAAAEVLFILDLQLADVFLKLIEIFFYCLSHRV